MNPIKLSRKKFILTAVLSAVLVGTVGYVLKTAQRTTRLFFSRFTEETLAWFARAVLPNEDGFPDIEQAEVVSRLDEELFFVDSSISGDFDTAIWILEFLPIRFGYWSRFSKLNREEAREFLNLALRSETELVRNIVSNVRMVVMLVYYGHKSTWNQIGYDGPFGNFPEKLSESRIYYKAQVRKN
ncbi:hypothetical protein A0128_10660 [Leptospira tipperaryensis]|uniref:Gluconate 2-dehydrogenase subunit 3 family protein n=1 Tax=Leptospira tipperaryensis TaxID=2564040 RepID=A0A1D7UXF6_9LEPT|nr:hypothetical protein [Leptospira tipperaryensis]AOP34268.1 hypothetical protein A0128_10660 [Leptospira tipperaryensis]